MNKVVAVRYGEKGIREVKLDNGSVVPISIAANTAESGLLENVQVGGTRGRDYHKTIRSAPDGCLENNLSNLSRF